MHPADYPKRRHEKLPVDFRALAALLGLPDDVKIHSVCVRNDVERLDVTLEGDRFPEVEHGAEPAFGDTTVLLARHPDEHFYARWPEAD